MIKQYRINQTVEAIQYDGTNGKEINDYFPDITAYVNAEIWDWVVKTMSGTVLVISDKTFHQLYSEVHE